LAPKSKPHLFPFCLRALTLQCCLGIWILLHSSSGHANDWPKSLQAVVIVEDDISLPASVAAKTLAAVEEYLNKSGSYDLLESEEVSQRLGHTADLLLEQCEQDVRCWSATVDRLGVDLLIHIAIGFLGSRESTWIRVFSAEGPLHNEALVALLPRGGGAPLNALNDLLHQSANLQIVLENGTTHLQVNGIPRLLRPAARINLSKMPPGKHEIVLEGLGLPPRVEVILIFPGKDLELPLRAATVVGLKPTQQWWGAWAGGGLFAGGMLAIWAGRNHTSQAWR
jgi:hypothetical protein